MLYEVITLVEFVMMLLDEVPVPVVPRERADPTADLGSGQLESCRPADLT